MVTSRAVTSCWSLAPYLCRVPNVLSKLHSTTWQGLVLNINDAGRCLPHIVIDIDSLTPFNILPVFVLLPKFLQQLKDAFGSLDLLEAKSSIVLYKYQ